MNPIVALLTGLSALASLLAFVVYFMVLAKRPNWMRVINGSGLFFTGMSYDNTVDLGASTWRHVSFVERTGVRQDGIEKPGLARKFGDLVFPQTNADRKEKLRGTIAAAGTRVMQIAAVIIRRSRASVLWATAPAIIR